MLDDIRRVFRRSMDAFLKEVATRDPEDQVAELLSAMRRELVAARAALPEFEAELVRARADLTREKNALADCERRGAMAEKIQDAETARIAVEFAGKHRERIVVLEQRVAAAEAELALRRSEADEMRRRYQEADDNRFALLAQLRNAASQHRMRSALRHDDGPLADFSRMEEKIRGEEYYVDALDAIDESRPSAPETAADAPVDLDTRLRELKRRMGRE